MAQRAQRQQQSGQISSIYQICVAAGFGSAPFPLNLSVSRDPRLFGVIGLFLFLSLVIMVMSRIPAPEITERPRPMSPDRLWRFSPSGARPVWLADRFDKRLVAPGLMAIGVASNLFIVFNYFHGLPTGLMVRKLYIRTERLTASGPYKVTTDPTSLGATKLDPRIEYRSTSLP